MNLILSPEFYWVRIFDLPMDSKRDVLGVLPSLFEEFIDITDKKFYVKKQDDGKFLCFAYDEHKIIDAIKNSNLTLSQVNGIHFGQIEFTSLVNNTAQTCMKVDNICLGFMDGVLVQVPIALRVSTDNNIDISSMELSKNSISVAQSSKYITPKNSYIVSAIMALFTLVFISKYVVNNQAISSIDQNIISLKTKHQLPASTIQTNAIVKKLNKISQKQIELRKLYKYIFDFKKRYGGSMVSVDFKNRKTTLKFTNIKAKKLVDYLEKRYTLSSAVVKENIVTVEVEL